MNFFRSARQSEYVPAVANYSRQRYIDADLVDAANESLIAMRKISNDLLQQAVDDLVKEQAEALRR